MVGLRDGLWMERPSHNLLGLQSVVHSKLSIAMRLSFMMLRVIKNVDHGKMFMRCFTGECEPQV